MMDSSVRLGHDGAYATMVKGPSISVVDDDYSVRESLNGWLKSNGFAVSTFASAEEFLASDQLCATDCLILDVRMPGMSGLELQRELAARHALIPIIFITAHSDEHLHAQAVQNGAVAVLDKPFGDAALLDGIRTALGKN